MHKSAIAAALLTLALSACADCSTSDEPICYKEECERTSDQKACATWIEYCRNNPKYKGCDG